MKRIRTGVCLALSAAALAAPGAVLGQAAGTVVYRCPGNVYTSDRELTQKQADEKGCKVIEGAPVTVIQGTRPRSNGAPVPAASGLRPPDARIDPSQQKARDSDARRILEDELKREDEALNAMKKEYNDGQPERRGDERNFQKYQDRVAEMKAAIARKEADIAAIKRELGKL